MLPELCCKAQRAPRLASIPSNEVRRRLVGILDVTAGPLHLVSPTRFAAVQIACLCPIARELLRLIFFATPVDGARVSAGCLPPPRPPGITADSSGVLLGFSLVVDDCNPLQRPEVVSVCILELLQNGLARGSFSH